jgi:hypothetical protein
MFWTIRLCIMSLFSMMHENIGNARVMVELYLVAISPFSGFEAPTRPTRHHKVVIFVLCHFTEMVGYICDRGANSNDSVELSLVPSADAYLVYCQMVTFRNSRRSTLVKCVVLLARGRFSSDSPMDTPAALRPGTMGASRSIFTAVLLIRRAITNPEGHSWRVNEPLGIFFQPRSGGIV